MLPETLLEQYRFWQARAIPFLAANPPPVAQRRLAAIWLATLAWMGDKLLQVSSQTQRGYLTHRT